MPPVGLCLCLYSHTASSLLFPPVACLYKMTQMQCANFAILFGIFLIGYKKYSCLGHCTTAWEIPGSIPSRVLGNFMATYSFCLHSAALSSTQLNRNEYLGIFLEWSGVSALSWQVCLPTCGKCQSKNVRPTFHPLSEFSWHVTGELYLYLLDFSNS
jgi:hypothetical protein